MIATRYWRLEKGIKYPSSFDERVQPRENPHCVSPEEKRTHGEPTEYTLDL